MQRSPIVTLPTAAVAAAASPEATVAGFVDAIRVLKRMIFVVIIRSAG